MEAYSKYAHSPAHLAVLRRDHTSLRAIISSLPRLAKAGEVNTEAESIEAEQIADAVSAVIDRRDVPGRETPLHVAVRIRDPISAEILMAAGANWSLQNEKGWSASQEAAYTREESIAKIIARHRRPLGWARWCRRLPRILASAARIRDFYMEMSFHFESSVIPFFGRIAPSDTYRIWKRGSNLRVDMTLDDFDGFKIQRSDKTFLFLGDGYSSDDGNISLPRGSLIVLAHKKKEIKNELEREGAQPTEAEVAHKVALMSQKDMCRPGIDVTRAELVSQLNWRRQERTEMVGSCKAKVYDMLHVTLTLKTRRAPGATLDEERMVNGGKNDDCDDVLIAEERAQLDGLEDDDNGVDDSLENGTAGAHGNCESNGAHKKKKKSWFGWKKGAKTGTDDPDDTKFSNKFSELAPEGSDQKSAAHQKASSSELARDVDSQKGKEKISKKKKKKVAHGESKRESEKVANGESKHEREYKTGLTPVLWLTPDFPLKTDELLPLLDMLANKVKTIRTLRELLTTKLPSGTFPVKIAIPIVPTIRVLVTFTEFQELQPLEEFSTPLSSPPHFQEAKPKEPEGPTSWISWMRGSHAGQSSHKDDFDPFHIPSDYAWIDAKERRRRRNAKKDKRRKA